MTGSRRDTGQQEREIVEERQKKDTCVWSAMRERKVRGHARREDQGTDSWQHVNAETREDRPLQPWSVRKNICTVEVEVQSLARGPERKETRCRLVMIVEGRGVACRGEARDNRRLRGY